MLKIIRKIYNHFNFEKPKDRLELIAYGAILPASIINFIVYTLIFIYTKSFATIDPQTREIVYTLTQEEIHIIGNQFVASLFIGLGFIVIPLLKSIYQHSITLDSVLYLALASFGLYSIFLDTYFIFFFVLFGLIVRNTEISKRISLIKEKKKFKQLYKKYFPTILD